ncbi:hypothetical protein P3T23_008743 [Paraburkholderia sp. GAS448]|uniref:hypothetical protein n=1 Tax=Paraburkholderia sp. GAS448 TaxID=3035136 RepID=UPI003D1A1685
MKQEGDRAPRDLTHPAYVEDLSSRWGAPPKSMIVIEYGGTGDPFFGGNADDRALGVDGLIQVRMSKVETAKFATIQEAHEAALKVANRRPNTILGVAPTWN